MHRYANGDPLLDQKRRERNIEVKYIVQIGSVMGLSLHVRQMTTRATDSESDLDKGRLIVQYPLNIFRKERSKIDNVFPAYLSQI